MRESIIPPLKKEEDPEFLNKVFMADCDEKTRDLFEPNEVSMTTEELERRKRKKFLDRVFEAKMDLMLTRLAIIRKDMEEARVKEE